MTSRLVALCAFVIIRTAAADPPKPVITADAVLSINGLGTSLRPEDQRTLEQLIADTPDSEVEEKADFYFRLATSYAATYRANPAKKEWLLRAVKVFKALTDNDAFRNYPRLDVALFYYGYTLQTGKYMKEARMAYDRLLKNFPTSIYVPEAHLAFADYYFDANQLADAEARYKMVLKFPKSSAYWYAMYKMGWIDLDLQRYQEALETFYQVAQATKNDRKQDALNHEAKLDFVRAYAAVGKVDKAYPAFQRVDGAFAPAMLERLAELYVENARPADAATLDRQLVKLAPTSADACRWQAALVRAVAGTAEEAKAADALVNMPQCAGQLSPEQQRRARRAVLAGWEQALPADATLAVPAKTVPAATAIPAADQALASALEGFADAADPDEPNRMKLAAAAIYRKYAHHDEAIAILADLVKYHGDSAIAERAADLWLDSLVQLHRFDAALVVVDAFDKRFVDGKPTLARNIQFLRSRSLR